MDDCKMASVVEAPHTKLLVQAEDLVEKSGITRAQVINLVSTFRQSGMLLRVCRVSEVRCGMAVPLV